LFGHSGLILYKKEIGGIMKFLKGIVPRDYQKNIFNTCKKKNCLVVLPTGLGKTLIALMLTIQRMTDFPGEKVLFLAPTRPLAEQHLNSFKKNLPELFASIEIFTGTVNAEKRKKLWRTSDIIFSTPQCISNDLQKNLYTLENVCLLVEDEAHRCMNNYAYNYVAQRYKQQSANQRILGLTASPGSELKRIKDICRNLSIEEVELRTRDSEDVKDYLQELTFENIKVDLPPEFIEIKVILEELYNKYVYELKNRKLLWEIPSKSSILRLQRKLILAISRGKKNFNNLLGVSACAQAIRISHAIGLLETQTISSLNRYLKDLFKKAATNKGASRLVSNPNFNLAVLKSDELLQKNIEHPKIGKLLEIVEREKMKNENVKILIFTQYRETASLLSKKLNSLEKIKSKVFVGQAKKQTGDSVSGMNQKKQKEVIEEFRERKINVLCATSIGEEGLDIPEVNLVIFYEPVPSAIRSIQRAGRTARLMKGKLIMLISQKTRDETYFYISKRKEKSMHSAIKEVKEKLSNKTFNPREMQEKL
jgi:Fanconi anemia group M protein